jgi:hypothetical protein
MRSADIVETATFTALRGAVHNITSGHWGLTSVLTLSFASHGEIGQGFSFAVILDDFVAAQDSNVCDGTLESSEHHGS